MAKKHKHPERFWLSVEKDIGSRGPYEIVLIPGRKEKKIRQERREAGKWVKRLRPLLRRAADPDKNSVEDTKLDGRLHSLELHMLAIWDTVSMAPFMCRLTQEVAAESQKQVNEQYLLLRRRQYAARKRARAKRNRTRKKKL